ncbi:MAG: crossover junction endodeoxyribonuclease RuvC [Bdellovibrionales bacterium]|nr:crossover junction endodeoxyribonuclease RuvC [Bdellovibrionales bacterium]
MRILGIDPGSNYLGLGCVEARGSALLCVGHAVVRIQAEEGMGWSSRLRGIFEAVDEAIRRWQPACAAAEQVFFAKNVESALKLGQARGAALAAAALRSLPIHEYAPTTIKQAVTSSGRADKTQVFQMVKLLLGASLAKHGDLVRHDASDALAIAICHAQHRILASPHELR